MNRTIAYTSLLVLAAFLASVSICAPTAISDENAFLGSFVNHEFLNVLGVILAITLASVAGIHLEFNRIEERYEQVGALKKSRASLAKAAYWLIALFVIAVVIVVVKPIVASGDASQAFFNSAALVIFLWHILILISLTQLVFKIEPIVTKTDNSNG